MKQCDCTKAQSRRAFTILLNMPGSGLKEPDAIMTTAGPMVKFDVFVCRNSIIKAHALPILFALISFILSVFVLGIDVNQIHKTWSTLLTIGKFIISGFLSSIAIVVFSAIMNTDYFIEKTINQHASQQYPEVETPENARFVILEEANIAHSKKNARMLITMVLGFAIFWLVMPALSSWLVNVMF
jgi:hypothetical protein